MLILALAACDPDRPLHIWAEEWSTNATTHWHACTDDGCPGKDAYDYHHFTLTQTTLWPTCSREGEGHYKCDVCGYEKDDAIPMTEHAYVLVKTLLAPTCNTQGRGTYMCTECSHTEDMRIPATGIHNFGESYGHDANSHWHVCLNDGCDATDEPQAHIGGQPTVAEHVWSDGSITSLCTVCGAVAEKVNIPSRKAPAAYDMKFTLDGTELSLTPGDVEYDVQTYKLTLMRKKSYVISLVNAVNSDGDSINLSNDVAWHMDDIYESHGLKIYYVNPRSGSETVLQEYQTFEGINLKGSTISFANSGAYKIIFRYETGVNDGNGNTRKIRVEKTVYVTVTGD